MFSCISRLASAGVSQLSRLSNMTTAISPSVVHPTPSTLLGSTNTAVVNTTVPRRGKRFEHHFINRWMARDYKRRALVKEYYPLRQRYIAIKRCSVLPKELQEIAAQELHAFPRDSCFTRTVNRCIFTSRPRWCIYRFRLSRIQWRLLADYNKLSGVLRATW